MDKNYFIKVLRQEMNNFEPFFFFRDQTVNSLTTKRRFKIIHILS